MDKENSSYRFDDWEDINMVDCNNCKHYLSDDCDGVPVGSEKPCKAFLATRKVLFPEKIKALEKAVRWLGVSVLILGAALVGVAMAVLYL